MTTEIDYSRPAGWWCATCGFAPMGKWTRLDCDLLAYPIPVYLPLPTPEPVEVDEVETGEAEVVTFTSLTSGRFRISGIDIEIGHDGNARGSWSDESEFVFDPVRVIDWCANQSANARKKRGMK